MTPIDCLCTALLSIAIWAIAWQLADDLIASLLLRGL